jgi:hypothetical protein
MARIVPCYATPEAGADVFNAQDIHKERTEFVGPLRDSNGAFTPCLIVSEELAKVVDHRGA